MAGPRRSQVGELVLGRGGVPVRRGRLGGTQAHQHPTRSVAELLEEGATVGVVGRDRDLDDRDTLAALGWEAGIDPAPLLDAALSPEIQAIYDANTQEAIERSIFGSPTYFVGGDMFYGQDHLELVERALVKPFSGSWPR